MGNIAEYFLKNRYQAVYEFGTRVFGYYKKIPFVGSIGSDSVVSEEFGPQITITLDLPMMIDGKIHNVTIVKHKDIKSLMYDYDAPVADRKARASKTPGSGFDSRPAHQKKTKPKSRSEALLENLKKLKGKK